MTNIFLTFLASVALGGALSTCSHLPDPANTLDFDPVPVVKDIKYDFGATPIWSDEFNYTGRPVGTKWSYDVGGSGWGNNELQYYTNGGNSYVANGYLTITAKRENFQGSAYTSSRMVTKFKGDFKYGRFEARMRLPTGRGTWPAFWLLPTDNAYGIWPNSGEIDIMEHVGYDPTRVHITTHTRAYNGANGLQRSGTRVVPTALISFHVYRVDWTPLTIRGFIDDEKVFEYPDLHTGTAQWPFNRRFHMLLNIAIGGNWGGLQGVDNTIFPATMLVDYVRVYPLFPPAR
jgi:beta-glucanase (GH16 family)